MVFNNKYNALIDGMVKAHEQTNKLQAEFNQRHSQIMANTADFTTLGARDSYNFFQQHMNASSISRQNSGLSQSSRSTGSNINPHLQIKDKNEGSSKQLNQFSTLNASNFLKPIKILTLDKSKTKIQGLKINQSLESFNQTEIHFESMGCMLVTHDILAKELSSENSFLGCKHVGLNSNFFDSLKGYMSATSTINKKVELLKAPLIQDNVSTFSTQLKVEDGLIYFPTPPKVPDTFESFNGTFEEKIVNLQFPSTPTHKVKIINNLCSLTFSNEEGDFIKIINKQINNYIYNDFETINTNSSIISSCYSDYFGVITKYQYLLLSFNNNTIFYLGSTITLTMYLVEFVTTMLIILTFARLLKECFIIIKNYIPNKIQVGLVPYFNLINILFSFYLNFILFIILYKGFVLADGWLISRILFIFCLKYNTKIINFFTTYKNLNILYVVNPNPKEQTSFYNIGL